MSILNEIARGSNPGAGLITMRQNQMAMQDRDREIKNQEYQKQWNEEERGYQREQNTLAAKAQNRDKATQFVLEIRKQASQLPSELRGGLVQNMWGMAGDLGVELPELSPQILKAFETMPLDDNGLSAYAAKQKTRIGLEQDAAAAERQRIETNPTSLEQAAITKATAAAQEAQFKVDEKQKVAEGAQQTKIELQELANEVLLDEDAINSVYGSMDGIWPSVMPGTIDAEAKIDRIVDMLTLENTSKMTGVLSESDIKILQRAGTILGNKRIRQETAKKELEKIAGIMRKAKVQELVDKYAN